MNYFKRALIHVKANLGKSLLIFIIFLVTMGAVSTAFMTSRMYNKTLEQTFKDGTVPVYVRNSYPDDLIGNITYNWNDYQEISSQQKFDIAELEEVESSDISMYSSLKPGQLTMPNETLDYGISINYVKNPEQSVSEGNKEAYQFDYDKELFKNNPQSIILNDLILDENNLEVGDTIVLDINSDYSEVESIPELEEQEFTIVGSYSAEPTQAMIDNENADAEKYGFEPDLTFSYLYTNAYIPLSAGKSYLKYYEGVDQQHGEAIGASATYYLKSLDDVNKFKTDVETLIDAQVEVEFDLNSEESETAEGLSVIIGIQSILNYFLLFGVVVVIVLLTILITLFIRGRKKEIGIMVALGETKRNIYFQLVFEQVIIMSLATILAYPICLAILTVLSSKFGFLALGLTIVPLIQSVIVGVIIIGLITLIPAIYTLRLQPKKILL